ERARTTSGSEPGEGIGQVSGDWNGGGGSEGAINGDIGGQVDNLPRAWMDRRRDACLRREIAEQGVPAEYLDRATIWGLLGLIEHLYRQLHLLEAHRPTGPLH